MLKFMKTYIIRSYLFFRVSYNKKIQKPVDKDVLV